MNSESVLNVFPVIFSRKLPQTSKFRMSCFPHMNDFYQYYLPFCCYDFYFGIAQGVSAKVDISSSRNPKINALTRIIPGITKSCLCICLPPTGSPSGKENLSFQSGERRNALKQYPNNNTNQRIVQLIINFTYRSLNIYDDLHIFICNQSVQETNTTALQNAIFFSFSGIWTDWN